MLYDDRLVNRVEEHKIKPRDVHNRFKVYQD